VIVIVLVFTLLIGIENQEIFPQLNRCRENIFLDVSCDNLNYGSIKFVKDYGAMTGYPDGSFRPDDPVTNEQVAIIMTRTKKLSYTGGLPDFSDVPKCIGLINIYGDSRESFVL